MFLITKWFEKKKEERRQKRIANRVNRWMTRREAMMKELGYEEI